MFSVLAPVYNVFLAGVQKRQGKEMLKKITPLVGKKVLDLGGGTGRLAAQIAAAGGYVWLVDASPQMLKQARRLLPTERAIFGDASGLPFSADTFDLITVVDALHHIVKQGEAFKECLRVLRPGGALYVLEFDPSLPYIRALAMLERALGEPALFLQPEVLAGKLEDAGFCEIKPEQIAAGEYIMRAVKPLG